MDVNGFLAFVLKFVNSSVDIILKKLTATSRAKMHSKKIWIKSLQGGEIMIDAAGGNLLGSPMYFKGNQSSGTGNGNATIPFSNPENTLLASHSVEISYRMESSITYNRSMTVSEKPVDDFELLRSLVLNIFKQQGLDCKVGPEEASIDIGTISPSAAQKLVSEDAYFGVEKTSERIFHLAVGIAGGDRSKISEIREGIEKGFQGALDALGGWLPDISYDTYESVMDKLDNWESASL